ncbi:MAG: type I glyceraldehyde-3-phosphate dehydrogenase [Alphaproteobacteria bacterium]
MTNVAINGFGRIGRLMLRAMLQHPSFGKEIKLIAINSPASAQSMAHLFKYDSMQGIYEKNVIATDDNIDFGFGKVFYSQIKQPQDINWQKLAVDIVLECSGKFNDREKAAQHLASGAKKILISAPSNGADKTIVYGVNHDQLTPADKIISAASCTTNCLAPILAVLENNIGIDNGFMTTIHAYTGDQNIVDNSHKDLRRARAAGLSMIPTSTGAAKSIGDVIPSLKGRLNGAAIRVPTANVSCVDLVARLKKPIKRQTLHDMFKQAEKGFLKNILKTTDLPLVSIDFNGMKESSCIDLPETMVCASGDEENQLVRVLSWYDNEMGFSHRMVDVLLKMTAK